MTCEFSTPHDASTDDFETRVVHAGPAPDPVTGAVLPPVHQNTTYLQDGVGRDRGFTYSRCGNPTVSALELALGQLEDAPPAIAFATGMAATTTLLLALCRAGDRVVCGDVVYGGTVRFLEKVLTGFGVEPCFVDTSDLDAVHQALREPTRLVFLESPANPTLKLTDLAAVAALARTAGAITCVDNTFLTAALQRPLELGADLSLYSTTKFLEGHNATVGGAIVTRDAGLAERIRFVRNTAGTIQAPWESWLTLRGIRTLSLRLERHSANALAVARFLAEHPAVAEVHYPGLDSFPQRELAQRQQRAAGGVLAFLLREDLPGGALEAGSRLMAALRLWTLAENLGAVESLVTHPATMTHGTMDPDARRKAGLADGLVRLSAGIERAEDLIADLDRALCVATAQAEEVVR